MYERLDKYIGEMITYKSICEVCELKYQKGNGKDAQIKDIQRYYKLDKVKTKYHVIEKYKDPLPKDDKRSETSASNSVKYADDIETIMLYTLQNKKEFVCTISQALLLCNLVNENYNVGKKDIPITSKLLNLDIENVYNFYDSTGRRLRDTFERALNRMRSKALLSYTKPIMVACNDVQIKLNELGEPKLVNGKISYKVKEVHRLATKEEVNVILDCEANTLNRLECDDMQRVFLAHKWNEFKRIVNEEISSRLNIKYYYEAYNIIANTKQIDRKIKNYENNGSKSILNYTILESLLNSLDKTETKLDEFGNRKYDDKFIADTKTMIETTINSKCTYNLKESIIRVKSGIDDINNDSELPF